MNPRFFFIVTGFAAIVTACQKPAHTTVQKFSFNDTINIRNFAAMVSDDQSVSIKMDSVLNDSRCPSGAQCIWAGNASVRFRLMLNGNPSTLILNTLNNPALKNDTIIEEIHFILTGLKPYPAIGSSISQDDYEARILVRHE